MMAIVRLYYGYREAICWLSYGYSMAIVGFDDCMGLLNARLSLDNEAMAPAAWR